MTQTKCDQSMPKGKMSGRWSESLCPAGCKIKQIGENYMLIYGVKISDIKKYNEQKAERFFEILQKTNASNIAEK